MGAVRCGRWLRRGRVDRLVAHPESLVLLAVRINSLPEISDSCREFCGAASGAGHSVRTKCRNTAPCVSFPNSKG